MSDLAKAWPRVVAWALVLGILVSLLADWGRWDRLPVNALWRVLITGLGGVVGLVLDYFAGNYVGMGTNIIESTGLFRFSSDSHVKIRNGFIFVGALVAAIFAFIFIR